MKTIICLFLAASILLSTSSIQIPLAQGKFQCMLVYSVSVDQTVKIDIDFPMISDAQKYLITIRNTKSGQLEEESIKYGHFRRQFNMSQNIIYEVCFQFISTQLSVHQVVVDYEAETHFMIKENDYKLPQNLLKTDQMKQIYENVRGIKDLVESLISVQDKKFSKEEKQLNDSLYRERQIVFVTVAESLLILAIGVFQYWQFRNKYNQFQVL